MKSALVELMIKTVSATRKSQLKKTTSSAKQDVWTGAEARVESKESGQLAQTSLSDYGRGAKSC